MRCEVILKGEDRLQRKNTDYNLKWSHLRIFKSVPPVNKSPPGKGSIARIPGKRGGGSLSSSTLYFGLTFRLTSSLRFVLLDGLAKAHGISDISSLS